MESSYSNKKIGEKIAKLRGDMSQNALAKKMQERGHGWIQTTVSAIEGGTRAVKLKESFDLAEVLGVTVYQLAKPTDVIDLQVLLRERAFKLGDSYEELLDKLSAFLGERENYTDAVEFGRPVTDEDIENLPEEDKERYTEAYQEFTLWNALLQATALWGEEPTETSKRLENEHQVKHIGTHTDLRNHLMNELKISYEQFYAALEQDEQDPTR